MLALAMLSATLCIPCWPAGFDRKVLEAQEEEERERQRRKDRKRERQVSSVVYMCMCFECCCMQLLLHNQGHTCCVACQQTQFLSSVSRS